MTSRKMSFEAARRLYVHRFTMEHVPAWSRASRDDGTFYAPHYRSDLEWYENTAFHGEPKHFGRRNECYSSNQTWPLGKALQRPFAS